MEIQDEDRSLHEAENALQQCISAFKEVNTKRFVIIIVQILSLNDSLEFLAKKSSCLGVFLTFISDLDCNIILNSCCCILFMCYVSLVGQCLVYLIYEINKAHDGYVYRPHFASAQVC